MNEKFNIDNKIDPTKYRRNLADKLKDVIKESGFEKAREYLKKTKEDVAKKFDNNKYAEDPKPTYEKAKELHLAQWLLEKYPGDYDRINTRIKELDLSNETSARITENFRNQVAENTPNLERLKGSNSDVILQHGKDNKFISLDIVKPEIDKEILLKSLFLSTPERYFTRRGVFLEKGEEKTVEDLMKNNFLVQKQITSIVIARPYKMSAHFGENNKNVYTISQHYQIKNEFMERRDIDRVQQSGDSGIDSNIENLAPLILRKSEIPILENFLKEVAKIFAEEEDLVKVKNKLNALKTPDFHEGVSKINGGFIELKEDGTLRLYGSSEKYGLSDRKKVVDVLNKDFPDRKFE